MLNFYNSRCINLIKSENSDVPLYTEEDHNHFIDLYFVLSYKFQRSSFLNEVCFVGIYLCTLFKLSCCSLTI